MRIFATLFRGWRLLAGVVITVIVTMLAAAFFLLSSQAQAAPEQPIACNHEVMVQAGIPCLFCHTDAIRSPI